MAAKRIIENEKDIEIIIEWMKKASDTQIVERIKVHYGVEVSTSYLKHLRGRRGWTKEGANRHKKATLKRKQQVT